jgi:glycosyltransferase involved in cell wall biosynthesis
MTDVVPDYEVRSFRAPAVRAQLAPSGPRFPGYRIAAIVPCHNEAAAIGKVVRDLRAAVPGMDVYVYDNCSTDNTADTARRAGAIVRREHRKGKGNVVRRAFADIDADIYLLVDGDDTYDAAAAPDLIQALLDGPHDHVLGIRAPEAGATEAYRPAHEAGNRALNRVVARIFGTDAEDMLSGYRVFSRRFVKSFPAASREFEIETELTVHCMAMRVPATAVQVGFRDRAAGTESKLRTYRDGWQILRLILNLARHERPLAFTARSPRCSPRSRPRSSSPRRSAYWPTLRRCRSRSRCSSSPRCA